MKNRSKNSRIFSSIFRLILTTLLFWSFDYFSKLYIHKNLDFGQDIPIIGNLVRITYVRNYFSGFGLLSRDSWYKLPVVVLIIGTILSIFAYYYRPMKKLMQRRSPHIYKFLCNIEEGVKSFASSDETKQRNNTTMHRVIYPLLIAAALGNTLDRFTYGYVIDFIDVGLSMYRWPTFNFADSYLVCTAVMVAFFGIDDIIGIEEPDTINEQQETSADTRKHARQKGLLRVQALLVALCAFFALTSYVLSKYEAFLKSQYHWVQFVISIVLLSLGSYSYVSLELDTLSNDEGKTGNVPENDESMTPQQAAEH